MGATNFKKVLQGYKKTFSLTTFVQFTKTLEFCVLPVTSCRPTWERVFSKLYTVKSKLRSTLKQELLEYLRPLYVEQDVVNGI